MNIQLQQFIYAVKASFDFTKVFKIISTAYSNEFSGQEYERMNKCLIENGFDSSFISPVEFYWNTEMGDASAGCWSPFNGNCVFLNSEYRPDDTDSGDFLKLVAVAGHELTHKIQFNTFGVFYFILAIPIIREFTIELSANKVTAGINKYYKIPECGWL
jgi:hypothetical protein